MGKKKERDFQGPLIDEIKETFDGCMVLKNDEQYIQGIPDLTILYKDKYAILECKRDCKASYRPNQEYYLDKLDKMSFARTIYPENKKEVMKELKDFFHCQNGKR